MFKQTKALLFFSALLLLALISCKKSKENNADPVGTISVSIDGTKTTFNNGAKATVMSVSGGYGINIKGNKLDPSASQTSLSFSVVSPSVISARSYVENAGSNPLLVMDYFFDVVFGIGTTSSAYGSTTSPVTVTISEINSASVKGTFSGELSYTDLNGNPAKNVLTNGAFNVSF